MEGHEAFVYGMAVGDAIGLGEQVGNLQDLLLDSYAENRSLVALVRTMLSDTEDVLNGKRATSFFCLRENKQARILFVNRYAASGLNPKNQTDAEIYAFAREIEDEYLRSNSTQMRLSMLTRKPGPKATEGVSPAALAAAKATIEDMDRTIDYQTAQLFAEGGLTAVLVDEVAQLLKGNPDAAYFSQKRDARRDYRQEIHRLSSTLKELPEPELDRRLADVAKELRSRGPAGPKPTP